MTANNGAPTDVRLERTTPLLAGYSRARDWLDRADRAIDRYKRDPLSVDGVDAMFDAILTLNHMRDWVYELHVRGNKNRWPDIKSLGDWCNHVGAKCKSIDLLSDIANAAKHRVRRNIDKMQVEELREGNIILNIFPGYETHILPKLASFGRLAPILPDHPDDEGRVVRFRHRAHIIYSNQHEGGWSYFIDVANRVRMFWAEMLDEIEPVIVGSAGCPQVDAEE